MADALVEFPSVVVSGIEIVVDQDRPLAAIVAAEGAVAFASWPGLDVGPVAPEPMLLPGPDGAWVHYPPSTVSLMDGSHDGVLVDRDSPAVHVRPDGAVSVVRTGARRAIGTSTGALWTKEDRPQHLDDDYLGGPLPDGWEEPTLLTVVRADGSTSTVRVDRFVYGVREEDGVVHLSVAPTPPIAEHDGGGITWGYRVGELTLAADAPFPSEVRFLDQHPDGLGPAVGPRRCWWTAHEWALPPEPARTIDLAGVPGSTWKRIELPEQRIADAIAAASQWFGDPNAFWHGHDGRMHPLAPGIREAEVHLEGDWPRTAVVVTFLHPYWQEGRLRRSIRVFDDAGRLTANPYADVSLMEDLETGDLPPVERARDGFLDV